MTVNSTGKLRFEILDLRLMLTVAANDVEGLASAAEWLEAADTIVEVSGPATDFAGTDTSELQALPGDANRNGVFDELDILQVATAGKYLTGELANWGEGDWNGDKLFDQLDIVAALQTGNYVQRDSTFSGLGPPLATYEVTITNLTEGQPFSPPVVATHRAVTSLFTVGEPASVGIQQIAENGNNAPLLEALADDKHVFDVEEATAPLVPADDPGGTGFGNSTTLTITSAKGAKYLSVATMLICTNDGFTGVDSLRLPKDVGDIVTAITVGYDARTEINTEDFADLVPPCQGLIGISSEDEGTGESDPSLAEGGVIMVHAGIVGGNDLVPEVHGWTDPVAQIVIERVG